MFPKQNTSMLLAGRCSPLSQEPDLLSAGPPRVLRGEREAKALRSQWGDNYIQSSKLHLFIHSPHPAAPQTGKYGAEQCWLLAVLARRRSRGKPGSRRQRATELRVRKESFSSKVLCSQMTLLLRWVNFQCSYHLWVATVVKLRESRNLDILAEGNDLDKLGWGIATAVCSIMYRTAHKQRLWVLMVRDGYHLKCH